MDKQAELALSAWQRIRNHLESERHRIYEEIRNYPPPIPACDAQFNYLLEERERITLELDRVKALSQESPTQRDSVKCIDEFIVSSNYIDGEMKQSIRSRFLEVRESRAPLEQQSAVRRRAADWVPAE